MSQQVKVDRDLVFKGNASHTGNVRGRFSFENKVIWYDDFVGKTIDKTNDYTFAAVNSGTATIAVPHMLQILCGNADNDDAEFAMGLDFYGQYNPVMEVRCRINDVDESAINVGWNDAQAEGSADEIAIMLAGAGPTLDTATADAALFVADKDASTYRLYCCSYKNTAAGAVLNSGITPTDTMWLTLRVELQDNGTTTNAIFYANSTGREINPATDLVGVELDAITRTDPICPYIALINHEGPDETFDIDYLKVWQDRY